MKRACATRPARLLACLASLALLASPALADDPADAPLSLEGYGGLLHTPSAWVHGVGAMHLLVTNAAPTEQTWSGSENLTFVTSLSMVPYLELGGRITEALADRGGMRDLSANAKLQLPLDRLFRRPGLPVALAVGTQDEGGAAPHFRTRYAVASGRLGPLALSAGWGTGPDRMDGVFGGASLRVTRFADVLGEYDARHWSAGLRLGADLKLLGAPLRASVLASRTLARGAPAVEWAAELAFPMRGRLDVSRAPAPEPEPPPCTPGLPALLDALADAGFENLRVGRDGDAIVVEVENDVYRHAESDGLGVVLGLVARETPRDVGAFRVRLLRAKLAVLEVSGPMPSLRAFFLGATEPAPALADALAVTVRPASRPVAWLEPGRRRGTALRPRLAISPAFQTAIATEVGLLDVVASVQPELVVPLWRGATGYVRWDLPFAWSDAFGEGGALRTARGNPAMLEGLLYQAAPLGRGLTALAGVGVIRSSAAGGIGELHWTTPGGRLALGLEGAATQDVFTDARRNALTASAGVWLPRVDVLAEARAGAFLGEDRGAMVRFSRFFGDTRVGFFFAKTDVAMAGFQVGLPLTPRRELRPGLVQLRGDNRWSQGVGTVVGDERNPVTFGVAAAPLTRWNVQEVFLDAARLTRSAVVADLPRARALFLSAVNPIAQHCPDDP